LLTIPADILGENVKRKLLCADDLTFAQRQSQAALQRGMNWNLAGAKARC
jgi:hypothetical protein